MFLNAVFRLFFLLLFCAEHRFVFDGDRPKGPVLGRFVPRYENARVKKPRKIHRLSCRFDRFERDLTKYSAVPVDDPTYGRTENV